MADGKSSKKAKGAASKGAAPASKKTQGKKEGTRYGTITNVRSDAKKGGGAGSRNKLRDGS